MGQTHPDPVLAANGFRKIVVSSPYVCIYKVFDDTIYIYRIVNGKTDYPKLLR
jgi:toxin ParE1/3/4